MVTMNNKRIRFLVIALFVGFNLVAQPFPEQIQASIKGTDLGKSNGQDASHRNRVVSSEKGGNGDHDIFRLLISANVRPKAGQLATLSKKMDATISQLQKKRWKINSEMKFLAHLFYKLHKQYLRLYTDYPSFDAMIKSGRYDCLTGSALYALVLGKLGIEYNIIETNHHVYLIIKGKEGNYLMESPDPLNGFVYQQSEIEYLR